MMRTTNMGSLKNWTLFAAALLGLSGCKLNGTIDRNQAPIANAGMDQELPAGTTVITLDGSGSFDPEGMLVQFIWQSVDPSITGIQPVAQPQVTLPGDGAYGFNLWVRDAKTSTSSVDQVVIAVGAMLSDPLKGTEAGSGGGDFMAMPDDACLALSMEPNAACKDCLCTPNAMGGCAEEITTCVMNADATYAGQCKALYDCAAVKMCTGSACYTPATCMAEVDAAAAGSPATCSQGPEASACGGATAIATCRMANCAGICP